MKGILPLPPLFHLKDSKLLSLRELSLGKHLFWNFYESLTHMVFSGISQHPSEGFPGGGAVLRPTGRPRGGRSVSPKVLEPVHFGAKNRRKNQYLTVHILVLFFRHSNGRPEHDLGLRFVVTQIWLRSCTFIMYTQICRKMEGNFRKKNLNGMKWLMPPPLLVCKYYL